MKNIDLLIEKYLSEVKKKKVKKVKKGKDSQYKWEKDVLNQEKWRNKKSKKGK